MNPEVRAHLENVIAAERERRLYVANTRIRFQYYYISEPDKEKLRAKMLDPAEDGPEINVIRNVYRGDAPWP